MREIRKLGALVACLCVLVLAPSAAWAQTEQTAEEGGIGAAAGLASLLYAPVKIVYALGGGLVGGLAWVFSAGDNDVAVPIINRSIRGDYVITPSHIRGERSIEFVGRDVHSYEIAAPPPPPAADPGW